MVLEENPDFWDVVKTIQGDHYDYVVNLPRNITRLVRLTQ